MWLVTTKTVTVFANIFDSEQRKEVSGVVGTSDVANQTINSSGPREGFILLAVVSLSLGLINLFPFLPLDGGHIFWSLVEKVRGRRVPFAGHGARRRDRLRARDHALLPRPLATTSAA